MLLSRSALLVVFLTSDRVRIPSHLGQGEDTVEGSGGASEQLALHQGSGRKEADLMSGEEGAGSHGDGDPQYNLPQCWG